MSLALINWSSIRKEMAQNLQRGRWVRLPQMSKSTAFWMSWCSNRKKVSLSSWPKRTHVRSSSMRPSRSLWVSTKVSYHHSSHISEVVHQTPSRRVLIPPLATKSLAWKRIVTPPPCSKRLQDNLSMTICYSLGLGASRIMMWSQWY